MDKKEWIVRPVDISIARRIVEIIHYSHSASNTATYLHGLFKKGHDLFDADCQGVAWWIPPTKSAAIASFPEGEWQKVLSLHRMALLPGVPKNGCSFLLSKSIRLIDRRLWHCLITYADTWRGHTGTIYKATNWDYMGLTKPSAVFLKDGKMMGRKRGGQTKTITQMKADGFIKVGDFPKHKFRMILNEKSHSSNPDR